MSRRAIVYLHGFASSPRSSKARFFGERAAALGWAYTCPDLNEPDFTTLTVSRMIDQVEAAVDGSGEGPVALVGSSLGAFVALHAAARMAGRDSGPVDRLVLLAPALDLVPSLEEEFGPARMAAWEHSGRLPIFHYGDDAMRELGWDVHARRAPVRQRRRCPSTCRRSSIRAVTTRWSCRRSRAMGGLAPERHPAPGR